MRKKIMDILAKKKVSKYDVIIERTNAYPISFEQNELKILQNKNTVGIGLRVFENGKVGFSYTNDIATFEDVVDFARESACYGKQLDIDLPGKSEYPSLPVYNDILWDERGWVNKGKEIIHKIESVAKDVKIDIDFTKAIADVEILNSEGFFGRYKKTLYAFVISGFAVLDSGFTFVYEIESSTKIFSDIDKAVDNLLEKLERARNVSKIRSGNIPVVFAPTSLMSLVRSISLGVDADNVKRGISPLKDRIGEKIFSDKITIIDNPYDYGLTGVKPFDGEGVPTRVTRVIENGVLKTYLHTLETAKHFGVEPTGNSQRSYKNIPSPGFNNLVIASGNRSLQEIIEDMDYGLLVEDVIGGGQSNLLRGDYSVNVGLGFLIENGEIKGRVRNTMVSGNVYDDFGRVIELSRESRKFMNFEIPYIAIDGVSVTSK